MVTKKVNSEHALLKADAEMYEMLYPIIAGLHKEMQELSKKKQDGALNVLKVRTINKALEKAKNLLTNEPSAEFLELLDEKMLPTNSDAVLIIVQYISAMEGFKIKNSVVEGLLRKWLTKD
ncbi:MAG TPA: hypothetical protein VG738_16020 [Chitinophagaceae bacterium]|nr:hypothetical protein [Chitinophagaceae bacterium]